MTKQVKVTQADREAAAAVAIVSDLRPIILEGRMDWHIYTQAFARHRIAAQAELLEALEFLADAASASKGFASPMALGQARTAIAKAKGEQ